jgi:hypothetical protein
MFAESMGALSRLARRQERPVARGGIYEVDAVVRPRLPEATLWSNPAQSVRAGDFPAKLGTTLPRQARGRIPCSGCGSSAPPQGLPS